MFGDQLFPVEQAEVTSSEIVEDQDLFSSSGDHAQTFEVLVSNKLTY